VKFAIERLDTALIEINDILGPQYWSEMSEYDKEQIPLDINWDIYKVFEENNSLFLITARYENVLVGFAAYIIYYLHQHKDVLSAEMDSIFLLPDYRKGLTGYRMIKYGIEQLRNHPQKIRVIGITVSKKRPFSSLLVRQGFRLMSYKYILEV